jgi:glycosyltransferase involved in cell wall biosynthesis
VGRPRILVNALSVTHGGGRTYALNLLRELEARDRGFAFTVLVPPGELEDIALSRVTREVVRLPGSPGALRLVSRIFYEELLLPLRSRSYDLLYCLADVVSPLCVTPVVVALVNLNIYDRTSYDNLRLRVLNALVRLGLWRARKVVFPTRAAAELIGVPLGVRGDRVAVVPHGIDAAPFASDVPPASGAPYLFAAAALERHKNLGVLIESLRHVSDPDLEVWIAGPDHTDPSYTAELRALAERLGLAERVRFLGAVPYERILGYYRGARAMVFPSLLETFGLPLLEAMLAESPIVAADIPTFREIAGDAALFFPPGDARALAGRVDEVAADPAAARARAVLGRDTAPRFSWKRSADDLCGVFRSVLARSS